MAEPIRCDVHNLDHLADVLVTQTANGETFAACHEGYLATCRALVAQVDAAEADATDAAAVAALEDAGPAPEPPTSPASSDVDAPAPERPTKRARGATVTDAGTDTPEGPSAAPGPS